MADHYSFISPHIQKEMQRKSYYIEEKRIRDHLLAHVLGIH